MFKLLALHCLHLLRWSRQQLVIFFPINSHIIHRFVQATNTSSANSLVPFYVGKYRLCLRPTAGKPSPSSSDVASTLNNLCTNSVTGTCPESASNPVQAVRTLYDILFIFPRFKRPFAQRTTLAIGVLLGPPQTLTTSMKTPPFQFRIYWPSFTSRETMVPSHAEIKLPLCPTSPQFRKTIFNSSFHTQSQFNSTVCYMCSPGSHRLHQFRVEHSVCIWNEQPTPSRSLHFTTLSKKNVL